ncbi:Carnitine O-acetyltransferase mitochondrial [Coemansia sp. RSA 2399]|nr:Carnitine O-acetyltransferase mitochondrial [Coemansia sp. RSA 2399]KAJ1904978.1 Carnitine O-acetyltransferase mitochondrial [Coemansia sp. IMI 209127]
MPGNSTVSQMYPTSSLQKLPVPELDDTVSRFVDVARPLFGKVEFESCLAKLNDFVANEGPVLQARLAERASSRENWLEEWWNDYAYFNNRASVCFNVNYFFGFRSTPQPLSQARLAAALIESAVRFRDDLESGRLEHDNIRGKAMCMHQYQYMFGTCRHPGASKDWTDVYSRAESSHVAVAHKGRFFVLRLPEAAAVAATSSTRQTTVDTIERHLQDIIDRTERAERAQSIGILTAALRDDWFAARECLLQVSSDNAASLHALESAAFLVSLDTASPATHKEFSLACHCGDGVDRYFDKNFQIIVFANGRYGFNGEHSLTDATTDMRLCNAMVREADDLSLDHPLARGTNDDGFRVEELKFDYSIELLDHIHRAIEYFDATVAAHELSTLTFDGYGKENIKKMKVSPDAYVQMAMQLAYYRRFRSVPPTYESASTKAFSRGRTETSRSVSHHSVEWCKAMVDIPETTSLQAKSELLKQAIAHQSQFTAQCAKGNGIDRHMLGLEHALLVGEPRPAIFADPVFTGSRHWKLSTSQISDSILDAYGWGEVVDDGFGVAYRIENESLHFNVVSQRLGSARLCQYLSDALMDMRFLLTNAHKQPHEIMAEVDAVANALTSIKLLSSSPKRPLSAQSATADGWQQASPRLPTPEAAAINDPKDASSFRGPFPAEAEIPGTMVVDELEQQLPSNEVICALETRLSRFVRESLYWALPSTS